MLLFRHHRARLLLLAAAIAACITLAWLQSGQITSVAEIANSMASRLELWQRSLIMLSDVPFTGAGLASFPIVLDRFYPSFLAGPDARIPHAHNLLLQASLDLGLAGGLAVMALLLSALIAAWRAVGKAPRRSFEWCLATGSAAALVVISVHGLVDAGLWAARSAPLFWALIGLGLAFGAPALDTQHMEGTC
jgi:O-antigen ligase